MEDSERLSYIYGGIVVAQKAIKKFTSALLRHPKKINWTKVSYKMGQVLEQHVIDTDIFIYISADPSYSFYDTCIHGQASVPSKWDCEKDLEIHVDISEDLFYNRILITPEYIEHVERMFVLTFIHELTHTTQYDDKVKEQLRGSKREQYLSSCFELDAYSTECAYEMSLNGGLRTTTEAYFRYNSVRDRKIFRKFRDMTLEKFAYLKNYK